ncbi:unnamed protein product, partial [Ectocarpus sp. 13 AM-2016]
MQDNGGIGANTPRPLAQSNSDKPELQSEKGTEQQRQPEDGSRLRARRVGNLRTLALVLREAEDAICAGERGGQDDRGSGGRVVDRHRAQASLSPVASDQFRRRKAEEVMAGDQDALASTCCLRPFWEAIQLGFLVRAAAGGRASTGRRAILGGYCRGGGRGTHPDGRGDRTGGLRRGVRADHRRQEKARRRPAVHCGKELVLKGPLQ